MQIAARQSFLTGRVVPPLPYDAEVEYLESTGTQYIDTGVELAAGLAFDAVFSLTQSPPTESMAFCGGRQGNTDRTNSRLLYYHISRPVIILQRGNLSSSAPQITADMNPHRYVSSDEKIQIDERVLTGSNVSASSGTFPIFGYQVSGSMQGTWPVRCYMLRLSSVSNDLLRDFIPVRVGSVGYLYDRVSGELFGNAGTGAFIIGPDK